MMKRRPLLAGGGLCMVAPALLSACASPPAGDPSRPAQSALTGQALPAADVALLNRITWGIDSTAASSFGRLSRRDYLGAQLHPASKPTLPASVQAQIDALRLYQKPMLTCVLEMEQRRRDADAVTDDDAKKAARQAYQQDMNRLARHAASASVLNALYSPDQLREQLTWFWFNHFNVHQSKSNLRAMVGDYEAGLRTHALGRFRDLLISSATHAAMIRYLDNEQNAAGRINENYAREVMELHTLGLDSGYTQKDVQELARVLTGLGINFSDQPPKLKPAQQALYRHQGATEFNPARHDFDDKRLLGETIAGSGWNEIIEQLTRLAKHPATARHVCTRLAVFLVADEPPPVLVDRMARAFSASDGDIAVTLQALFDAPEFTASLGHKFKDPVHFVVSAVRLAYDAKPIANPGPMLGWLNRLGQGLYNRQTPDGYPLDEAAWSSSGQMSTRFEIARTVGSGSAGLFRTEGPDPIDLPAFPQLSNALFYGSLAQTLGDPTRAALASAASAQEWNTLLLSSPEFMYR